MICGSGGSKSRLAKAAGAGPSGQIRDEKVHAVVARSAFQSQNVQSMTGSEHFWKSGSRKSARRCGAKNTSTLEHFWKLRSRKSARRYVARYLWTLKRRFLWLLEHQIFRFAKITLRNSCSISYALRMTWHHFFVAYFRQMELKNRKTNWYEAVSSALNFPLLKEVSQNCFVFDVVKSKN